MLERADAGQRQHHPLQRPITGDSGRDTDDQQHREEEAHDGTPFGRGSVQRPIKRMAGWRAASRERLQTLRAASRLDGEVPEAVKYRRHAVEHLEQRAGLR